MKQYIGCFFFVLLLITSEFVGAKEIIGQVEKIRLNNFDIIFKAKIDTGAKNSSLNATNLQVITSDGKDLVKFTITNSDGKTIDLEKPLERYVKIKRKGAGLQQRPVVLMDVCLGKVLQTIEVNLVDRSNFNYQMLIGRSFLKGVFIVDVELSYTSSPQCK